VTYGDWTVDLIQFVADNRERLVLKPASDYGGHGVALGMETAQDVWDGILAEHSSLADFIVQEYVPVPEEMFPVIEDGHVQMRLKRFNINPFGIGGRHAGSITRISDRAVINVSAGGGLLPSVIGRHKRRLLAEDDEEEVSMATSHDFPVTPLGYDVDENAIRFSNYFHVLRELVHLSCGWLPLEPRLEVKYALGDHLHDDARSVAKIKRRLYELRTPSDYPGAPRRGARRPAGARQRRAGRRRLPRDRPTASSSRRDRRDRGPPGASRTVTTSPRCAAHPAAPPQ
jgi:hypothetical protein